MTHTVHPECKAIEGKISVENLITENLDIWTSAIKKRGSQGRGSNKKIELYGIKKLRELILELAVRGLLVPQDPNDDPASVLLEKSFTEKSLLIKNKAIPKTKPQAEIDDKEKPHTIPASWVWVRFGNIAQHNSGKTLDNSRNSGIARKYLTTSNLYWGQFKLDTVKEMLIRDDELDRCTAEKGDLLICEGGEAGRAAVWEKEYNICFQNHVHRARFFSACNPYYAYRLFEKITYTGEINNYRKGVGISNMSGKSLSSVIFPLPPEAEQPRIVAKVDELMALCDQLEQQTETSLTAHQTLVETLLNTLLNADQNSFDPAWERIAQHFDILFTTEHSIDQLKQTILQLAVMGKLVPQDPNDEPASVLLEKIAAEKEQLIKDKKIKKQKELVSFTGLDEMKNRIPNSWEWIRLSDSADIVRGGSPRPAGDPKFYDGHIPFLKVGDITNNKGKFVEGFNSTIKEAGLHKTRYIDKKTVLLSNSGATLGVPAICDFPATFNDGIAAFVERSASLTDEYLYLYLKTLTKWFHDIASRGQGQPNLNTDIIKATWLPLPPIKEQDRIVARTDELMALCDVLKASLREAQTTQLHLADAMAEQALNS